MIVAFLFAVALGIAELARREWVRLHTFKITKRRELPSDPEAVRKWDKEFFSEPREYRNDESLMLRPAPWNWH